MAEQLPNAAPFRLSSAVGHVGAGLRNDSHESANKDDAWVAVRMQV